MARNNVINVYSVVNTKLTVVVVCMWLIAFGRSVCRSEN